MIVPSLLFWSDLASLIISPSCFLHSLRNLLLTIVSGRRDGFKGIFTGNIYSLTPRPTVFTGQALGEVLAKPIETTERVVANALNLIEINRYFKRAFGASDVFKCLIETGIAGPQNRNGILFREEITPVSTGQRWTILMYCLMHKGIANSFPVVGNEFENFVPNGLLLMGIEILRDRERPVSRKDAIAPALIDINKVFVLFKHPLIIGIGIEKLNNFVQPIERNFKRFC